MECSRAVVERSSSSIVVDRGQKADLLPFLLILILTNPFAILRESYLPPDEGFENKPEIESGRPRLTEAGQPCWKCSTPVMKQTARKRSSRDYYYEYYLWCPKCLATYEVEDAKRFIEQPPELF